MIPTIIRIKIITMTKISPTTRPMLVDSEGGWVGLDAAAENKKGKKVKINSLLSVIVRVSIVPKRTVVVDND